MDKLIFDLTNTKDDDKPAIIRIDEEAAILLHYVAMKTGLTKKDIVSSMIKFCYPRLEVHHVNLNFVDIREEQTESFDADDLKGGEQ